MGMNDILAKRLYEARNKRGLTQSQAAEALGVSFQSVSLWERGETSPEISKLSAIAQLYSVSADWLLGLKDGKVGEKIPGKLFDEEHMYSRVKARVSAHNMPQSQIALPFARDKHRGQTRKGKDNVPYIYHPLLMCCQALALGIEDDSLTAATLLHDVCEDCEVSPSELPVSAETANIVALLTKDKTRPTKEYYEGILTNPKAVIVKLLDRCCNVSEMTAAFGDAKLREYIDETYKYTFPLMKKAEAMYPHYSDVIFILRYHILSVIRSTEFMLER